MTYAQIKENAFKGFDNYSIEDLKKRLFDLMNSTEQGSGIVFNILLDYLESKMPEAEFVAFCDSL